MATAKLKFDEKEIEIGEDVTTLGRASDNIIAFPSDSNVSRYHADIEQRDGEFWLTDLGSSNGTTVNGERVENDRVLKDGDEILLGGTSKIVFSIEKSDEKENDEEPEVPAGAGVKADDFQAKEEAEIAEDAQATSKLPWIFGIMGAVCGLAIVFVVAAVLFSYCSAPTKCEATAKIIKPENGETIYEAADIEVEAQNTDCVARAIFLINGVEFARTEEQPFTASIDPGKFPELANGSLQTIQIVLEDMEGNKIVQPGDIALNLETVEIATPTPTPTDIAENTTPTPKEETDKKVTLSDTQELSKKFAGQLSGNLKYNTSNPQFLQEVQKQTAQFVSEGYFARAQKYKDVINVAFVQEENLEASLGFILAMSRSQFKPEKQGAKEGLWQMNNEFVTTNSYNALCGTQTLSDPSQECAARAAALYLKALVLTVFEGDTIYSVAAFGMSPQEANIWKSSLPADRSDFWNVIKNPKQREEVAKFIAAGIVAENPQKFGLKNERPISQLYP